jgi:hypothetical protein
MAACVKPYFKDFIGKTYFTVPSAASTRRPLLKLHLELFERSLLARGGDRSRENWSKEAYREKHMKTERS